MSRTKHLVTAVTAVIVVATGLSVTAALLRRQAASGEGGEPGGHSHGAGQMQGMKMDENKSAEHPAGHGDEGQGQAAGHSHAQAHAEDADGAAKPQSMQGHAMPSSAPSAAEMLEPLLSSTRPASTAPAAIQYTCPMHPEVISDKPGKCQKCGMRLVQKK